MLKKEEELIKQGAFTIMAEEADYGKRLDFFVTQKNPDCHRNLAADLTKNGFVLVNQCQKKPGYKLKPGDVVTGFVPQPEPIQFDPEPIHLDIIFEDNDIIVLNKQAGLVVHPAPGNWSGTLVNGLLYHCPSIEEAGDEVRPGIVHRLDRDTSGVMVVAKNRKALNGLSLSFKERNVKKEYTAIVCGNVKNDNGIITLPVGRHPVDRKKMSVNSRKGRYAETHWTVEQRFDCASKLNFEIKTGRTHQIRVHCKSMQHPVAGDRVYGGSNTRFFKRFGSGVESAFTNISRQMLHSMRLGFTHPVTNKKLLFEASLPDDFKSLVDDLNSFS